jgi:hypothetical protein
MKEREMDMNRQSDHGYTTSPNEYRDLAVCISKARSCLRLARQYAGTDFQARFRFQARQWIQEAKFYRHWDRVHNAVAADAARRSFPTVAVAQAYWKAANTYGAY